MRKINVMFSRTYNVEIEVPDDFNLDDAEQKARDLVIDNDDQSVFIGSLEFNGIEDVEKDG